MPITDYSYLSIFTTGVTYYYHVKNSFYEVSEVRITSGLVE